MALWGFWAKSRMDGVEWACTVMTTRAPTLLKTLFQSYPQIQLFLTPVMKKQDFDTLTHVHETFIMGQFYGKLWIKIRTYLVYVVLGIGYGPQNMKIKVLHLQKACDVAAHVAWEILPTA